MTRPSQHIEERLEVLKDALDVPEHPPEIDASRYPLLAEDYVRGQLILHIHLWTRTPDGDPKDGDYCIRLEGNVDVGLLGEDDNVVIALEPEGLILKAESDRRYYAVFVGLRESLERGQRGQLRHVISLARLMPVDQCPLFTADSRQAGLQVSAKGIPRVVDREMNLPLVPLREIRRCAGQHELPCEMVQRRVEIVREVPDENSLAKQRIARQVVKADHAIAGLEVEIGPENYRVGWAGNCAVYLGLKGLQVFTCALPLLPASGEVATHGE